MMAASEERKIIASLMLLVITTTAGILDHDTFAGPAFGFWLGWGVHIAWLRL